MGEMAAWGHEALWGCIHQMGEFATMMDCLPNSVRGIHGITIICYLVHKRI